MITDRKPPGLPVTRSELVNFEKVADDFYPTVSCVFKGVQYETITGDPHFRQQIEDYFGTEEASQLLFEYDASRAEDPGQRAVAKNSSN